VGPDGRKTVLDTVLAVAAYLSLAVGVGLAAVKLGWPRVAPKVQVRRFRRRLKSIDGIVAGWADQLKGRGQPGRHEERHPETTPPDTARPDTTDEP
jgi:hypothetical protein